MDPLILERVAAGWSRALVGLAFRGLTDEIWGVRFFFGPKPGERGATWSLSARWPEPLWLWLEETPLPKERDRVDQVRRHEGRVVESLSPPAFDRRLRVNLDRGVFCEVEAWPPGNALVADPKRGVVWVAKRRAPSTLRPGLGPGVAYSDPPTQFRKDPRGATAPQVEETIGPFPSPGTDLSSLAEKLQHHWSGVPGPLARHAAAALKDAASNEDAATRLSEWARRAYAPDAPVTSLSWHDKHRSVTLVSATLPFVPGPDVQVAGPWSTWSEAARGVASGLPAAITFEELADARTRVRRAERALRALEGDLEEAQNASRLRRMGEALAAYHTQVPRRAERAELPDPAEPEKRLVIELDPKLAPHENANRYFKRAAKLERALTSIPARRAVLIAELVRARSAYEALEAGKRPDGAVAPSPARGSLSPSRPARSTLGPRPSGGDEIPAKLQPRRYRTREGWEVWVGKSNEGNDYLTHRLARPEDYWFHVQGSPGSHVVLRRGKAKDEPSRETLREVAAWAAHFSKQKTSGAVPVIYTRKKYVRKPRGSKPGLAEILRDEKSVFVRPVEPPAPLEIPEDNGSA